ncbi:UL36 very large tegument protein [Streptomyces sp. NBC_01216]|nr:UL36 very large tegument protein [Streptomyces sp. NBC_01216]
MAVYQLPAAVGAFARFLRDLTARMEPGEGWYGVFLQRDPDGLRACLEGTEILPWDVVESLLRDLGEAGPGALRARVLYDAAAAAHDRRPGGAEELRRRLAAMERERWDAQRRGHELAGRLRETPAAPDAARLDNELAWCRDDHARATARVAELAGRLAALTPAAADGGASPAAGAETTRGGPERREATRQPTERHPAERPEDARWEAPRRRPRGARYAWLDEAEGAQEVVAVPTLPQAGVAPRGARFGGAAEPAAAPRPATPDEGPAEAARAAVNAVYALRRLRAQGRSGEAHALLCEALAGPPSRLPALAAELHRAGLGPDWATLLWEAASLPPERLASVAGALADAGRERDCEQLLRQGVARPVEELAGACAALRADGHDREAHALLVAFVRARSAEEGATLAAADPQGIVPRLLAAARAVSVARERDLAHALRVAGLVAS